jgi:HAD superfamily hydrolase (TIGR01662 family)
MIPRPSGLLFDYGGTLVEELEFNTRAGIDVLLAHAVNRSEIDVDEVVARTDRVYREVADRRDLFRVETPWPSLTRLIHDFCGTHFTVPLADLELDFWNASAKTRPMPGVYDALSEFSRLGVPMGVVSNSSFGRAVIRNELAKHGLAEFLAIVVVSAEYAVRKPNSLLFETAAALLNVPCADVWFVGDRLDTDVAGARAAGMNAFWYAPVSVRSGTETGDVAMTWPEIVATLRAAFPEGLISETSRVTLEESP